MSDKNQDVETIDEEEYVLEGFPKPKQIAEWHQKYPNSEIRGYPFPNLYIVYRSYDLAEFEEVGQERIRREQALGRYFSEQEAEALLLEKFVLFPTDFMERYASKTLPAGIPSTIANHIMISSGFVDLTPETL